jgi:hypothetical protein
MQAVAFILATLVLLPYALLASAFVLFGYAISGGTLASFIQAIFAEATWLIPWGVVGAACFLVVLVGLGVNQSTRKVGAVILLVLALASIAAIWLLPTNTIGVAEFTFLLPCVAVVGVGAWLSLSQ